LDGVAAVGEVAVDDFEAGLPFPDEGAHEFFAGGVFPGFDEAFEGVALDGEVDGAGGDVIPGLGEGVVEVVPADLGEHEGFALLGGEVEDVGLDGLPGFDEFGDGVLGSSASSL